MLRSIPRRRRRRGWIAITVPNVVIRFTVRAGLAIALNGGARGIPNVADWTASEKSRVAVYGKPWFLFNWVAD